MSGLGDALEEAQLRAAMTATSPMGVAPVPTPVPPAAAPFGSYEDAPSPSSINNHVIDPSGQYEEFTVDFELGEDAPRNATARAAQEARWAMAKERVDARQHFSLRELLQVQKPAILKAMQDYHRTKMLVSALGHREAVLEQEDKESESVRHVGSTAPAGEESPPAAESLIKKLTPELLELVIESAMPGQGPLVPAMHEPPPTTLAPPDAFRVFVRVRPLQEYELGVGEYSSVDEAAHARLVCHDARLARSGRRLTMLHRWYRVDRLFPSSACEDGVCDGVLQPLLERVLCGLGDCTALLYGQTGAGKTYTMSSLLRRVAREVDARIGRGIEQPAAVEVTFFEVAADGCVDLLADRRKIALRSDENDVVHACGARSVVVHTAAELEAALQAGLALRSTVETQANPISSRSHAICNLRFLLPPPPGSPSTAGGTATSGASQPPEAADALADAADADGAAAADTAPGAGRLLRLVDLAGSERNNETLFETSRTFQKETIAINKSLLALKDCFRESARARAAASTRTPDAAAGRSDMKAVKAPVDDKAARPPVDEPWRSRHGVTHRLPVRIPYRASMLTRVLRDCFADPSHRTAIVAAVAPGAESVLHTLNTLDHVSLMAPHLWQHSCEVEVPMLGAAGGGSYSYESTPVHEWTAEQVVEWLGTAQAGRFAQVVVPKGIAGKDLLGMTARRLTEMLESDQNAGRADGESWMLSSQARVARALFEALRDAQRNGPMRRGGPSGGLVGSLQQARRTDSWA
jgi:hypothetical protein